MNWPAIFLGCFVIGFVLSALSFGAVALHFPVHLPFIHHVHVPHAPHVGHVGHAGHAGHGSAGVSPLNFATLMAFLAWFGGTGYLLTSEFRWLTMPALTTATVGGLAGAAVMFWVMSRVLWSPRENMQSADFQMVGMLGRVSQSVREGGMGELVYSHGGARHSCGARSADGGAIDKGQEVVVTAYDRGIATVRRWDDLMTDES
jgi:membrane protein implicated in regulation of membrane protease activity